MFFELALSVLDDVHSNLWRGSSVLLLTFLSVDSFVLNFNILHKVND